MNQHDTKQAPLARIHKYLLKPCKHEILKLEIMRAIEQYVLERDYRLLFEERTGLERLSIIGELAAGFVHEIRNPVAVISLNTEMGLAKLSEETVQTEKIQDVLSEILRQCQRLSVAIDHIMEFARPNRMDYAHVALEDLIERALIFIREEMDFEHNRPGIQRCGDHRCLAGALCSHLYVDPLRHLFDHHPSDGLA